MVMEAINVKYKGYEVGAVSFNTDTGIGAFEYDPAFDSQCGKVLQVQQRKPS